ncbi:hypothetical protein SUNI508_10312 [Seiridium unicorne]|uniref:Uncharacterized protein n=1 Tax=Seiridium unicorne TaxID=138068 RepID=A0ABR2ULZ3_9PEZI
MTKLDEGPWKVDSNWTALYVILFLVPIVFVCIAVCSVWRDRRLGAQQKKQPAPLLPSYEPRPFGSPGRQLEEQVHSRRNSLQTIPRTPQRLRVPLPLPHPSGPSQDN